MEVSEIVTKISEIERALFLDSQRKDSQSLSENMFMLGEYTSALDKALGDVEEELEVKWAKEYTKALEEKLSATAAKQQADVECAEAKGNVKRLTRYVSSSWKNHTSTMARINHLNQQWNAGSKIT